MTSLLAFGVAKRRSAIANECALAHFPLAAEPEDLSFAYGWPVSTQVGSSAFRTEKSSELLIFEDAGLGIHVGRETCDGGRGGPE